MKREPGSPLSQAAATEESTPRTLRRERASHILPKTSRGRKGKWGQKKREQQQQQQQQQQNPRERLPLKMFSGGGTGAASPSEHRWRGGGGGRVLPSSKKARSVRRRRAHPITAAADVVRVKGDGEEGDERSAERGASRRTLLKEERARGAPGAAPRPGGGRSWTGAGGGRRGERNESSSPRRAATRDCACARTQLGLMLDFFFFIVSANSCNTIEII